VCLCVNSLNTETINKSDEWAYEVNFRQQVYKEICDRKLSRGVHNSDWKMQG